MNLLDLWKCDFSWDQSHYIGEPRYKCRTWRLLNQPFNLGICFLFIKWWYNYMAWPHIWLLALTVIMGFSCKEELDSWLFMLDLPLFFFWRFQLINAAFSLYNSSYGTVMRASIVKKSWINDSSCYIYLSLSFLSFVLFFLFVYFAFSADLYCISLDFTLFFYFHVQRKQ